MKKYIILPAALLAALFLSAGCQEDPPVVNTAEDHFKELTDMGMHNESSSVYLYGEEAAQYAVSAEHFATRIQNDDKSKFLSIVMGAEPQAGNTLAATVTSHGISGSGAAGEMSLKVIKMETEKIWLMDETGTTCFVMPWTIDN